MVFGYRNKHLVSFVHMGKTVAVRDEVKAFGGVAREYYLVGG